MFCTKCGKELVDGTKFCTGCGAAVEDASAPAFEQPTRQLDPAPMSQQQPVYAEQPVYQTPTYYPSDMPPYPEKPAEPQKKGHGKVIAIVVAIICVIAIAVGAFFFFNSQNAANTEQTNQNTTATSTNADNGAAQIESTWQSKLNAISTSGTTHDAQLTNYRSLKSLKSSLATARSNGELKLTDGSNWDSSNYEASIDAKIKTIQDWFISDYSTQLNSYKLNSDDSPKTVSPEAAEATVNEISSLKSQMQAESEIWGDQPSSNSTYTNMLSSVDSQLALAEKVYAECEAAAAARMAS